MRRTILLSLAAAASLTACATQRASDRTTTREPTSRGSPIASAHPFELEGKVISVGDGLLGVGRSVTIERSDAPSAQLKVAEETRINIDDRPARLADLREGDEVRATFDFDGGTATAIEISAKPRAR